MTLHFTEEETEWIIMEPFNWHIADGCPDDIAKNIQRKLDRLKAQNYESIQFVNDKKCVIKNDHYGIQLIESPLDERHINVMVANWKAHFSMLEEDIIKRIVIDDINPQNMECAFTRSIS